MLCVSFPWFSQGYPPGGSWSSISTLLGLFKPPIYLIMALSIISLNVNGLRESFRCKGLLQWLRSLSVTVDVVSLQETHCTSDVECHSWFSSSGFSFVLSPGTCRSDSCIVLYCPVLNLVNCWCEVPDRSLSFPSMMAPFMCFVYMHLIATLLEIWPRLFKGWITLSTG